MGFVLFFLFFWGGFWFGFCLRRSQDGAKNTNLTHQGEIRPPQGAPERHDPNPRRKLGSLAKSGIIDANLIHVQLEGGLRKKK